MKGNHCFSPYIQHLVICLQLSILSCFPPSIVLFILSSFLMYIADFQFPWVYCFFFRHDRELVFFVQYVYMYAISMYTLHSEKHTDFSTWNVPRHHLCLTHCVPLCSVQDQNETVQALTCLQCSSPTLRLHSRMAFCSSYWPQTCENIIVIGRNIKW